MRHAALFLHHITSVTQAQITSDSPETGKYTIHRIVFTDTDGTQFQLDAFLEVASVLPPGFVEVKS